MDSRANKKRINDITERFQAVRFTRRSLTYVARSLLLLCLALGLCVFAFVSCARLSGSYIIVNEGMAQRVEYILKEGSLEELRPYFTEKCIFSDGKLPDATYKQYTVDSYSYELSFESFTLWPWLSYIQVEVIEQVNAIQGSVLSSAMNFPPKPPTWTPIRYRLTLIKEEGSWRIDEITPLELGMELEPPATYDPNKSPLPMATLTPTPTPSPRPVPTVGYLG